MSRNYSEVVSLWKEKILSKLYHNTDHIRIEAQSDHNEKYFTKYFRNNDIDSFTFSEELILDNSGNVSGIKYSFCVLVFNLIN